VVCHETASEAGAPGKDLEHDDDSDRIARGDGAGRARGRLLTPQALKRLLTDALKRQQAADALLSIADRVAAAGIEAMSMQEIHAGVKVARRSGAHVSAVIDTHVLIAGLLWPARYTVGSHLE
jgi:hypothetical protein